LQLFNQQEKRVKAFVLCLSVRLSLALRVPLKICFDFKRLKQCHLCGFLQVVRFSFTPVGLRLLSRPDMSFRRIYLCYSCNIMDTKGGYRKNGCILLDLVSYVRNRSAPLTLNLVVHFMTRILCPLGTACHHLIYCKISKPHRESSDFRGAASLSG
jgi:hypothetical protein